MDESSVGFARKSQHEVTDDENGPACECARWVAEDDRVACSIRSCAKQVLDIGVAADHPVQHDDVGDVDSSRRRGEIDAEQPPDPTRDPCFVDQAGGLGLVCSGEFEIDGACRTPSKQLELNLTDSAADLEDCGIVDAGRREEADDAPLWQGEPLSSIATGCLASESVIEDLLVPLGTRRRAAIVHGISMQPVGAHGSARSWDHRRQPVAKI
ncbi:hypothetical protein [Agromyces humatus]|uniref:hypothetical protein n=1 Tax=Agromyces humatus TaxID=279573 RepID=UPI0027DF1781|nr:hypothetical protein [Agromyces humatus]